MSSGLRWVPWRGPGRGGRLLLVQVTAGHCWKSMLSRGPCSATQARTSRAGIAFGRARRAQAGAAAGCRSGPRARLRRGHLYRAAPRRVDGTKLIEPHARRELKNARGVGAALEVKACRPRTIGREGVLRATHSSISDFVEGRPNTVEGPPGVHGGGLIVSCFVGQRTHTSGKPKATGRRGRARRFEIAFIHKSTAFGAQRSVASVRAATHSHSSHTS